MPEAAAWSTSVLASVVVLLVLLVSMGSVASRVASSSPTTYGVSFHETGLSGQTWNVTLGSITKSTNAQGGWITFQEPNGSYSYSVTAPGGFNVTPTSGTVNVSGQNPRFVSVTFTTGSLTSAPTTYHVSFQETGLSGQTWNVTLGSVTQSTNGQGGWLSFQEPNGSYAYTIGAPQGFNASPTAGTVTVSGANPHYVPVTFSPSQRYSVSFGESGLSGQNWSVTLSGLSGTRTTSTSSGTSIAFSEPNGSYNYTIGTPGGYVANASSGSAVVAGQNVTNISVNFSRSAGLPTPIDHVVVIMMENQNLNTTITYGHYLGYLWST